MLTIPFIHHRPDDHREHTTIQVKVQLRERKRDEVRQFTPALPGDSTQDSVNIRAMKVLLTGLQPLVSKGHNRAEGLKTKTPTFKGSQPE